MAGQRGGRWWLVLAGGGSRSTTWRQVIADVLGRPVLPVPRDAAAHAAAYGAARCGARLLGLDLPPPALDPALLVHPGPDAAGYPALRPVWHTLPGNRVDGIWAAWDEPALGAAQAVQQAGGRQVVVGVDGQDFALAEIKKGGPFRATVKQDWAAIARRTTDLIAGQFDGQQSTEREYALPGTLVTG
ncbi:substrate-binding domain-containing protein [Micromonospora sp. Llam7]|uniref:substrate-binding domain-containing protein n=1 Tax=Micromonospora tarapacensis TaxID=2835305 RepID=UPI001C828828|nr:substrate-binding domain-containing protein [Micromonospora tarapacensis]MBX7268183.1 substrate-binding domain-containing protein [Micromonospora tarapacensis]